MGHYSLAQKTQFLQTWAASAAPLINELADKKTPVLCYRGMSGVAHATALSLAYFNLTNKQIGMMYVRKKTENSHGNMVEHSLNENSKEKHFLIFVDDVIGSGTTKRITIATCYKQLEKLNISQDKKKFGIITEINWDSAVPNCCIQEYKYVFEYPSMDYYKHS